MTLIGLLNINAIDERKKRGEKGGSRENEEDVHENKVQRKQQEVLWSDNPSLNKLLQLAVIICNNFCNNFWTKHYHHTVLCTNKFARARG